MCRLYCIIMHDSFPVKDNILLAIMIFGIYRVMVVDIKIMQSKDFVYFVIYCNNNSHLLLYYQMALISLSLSLF